jgi:DNA-binding transcriptional MerR regulator
MTAFTIQDVSRRSGLSEPTLRYYEEVGLIGPVDRDGSSGHRRYSSEDVDTLQMLACLSYWDAAIIEAARALGCTHVLSEDLSDGQDYGGVRVTNPFREAVGRAPAR